MPVTKKIIKSYEFDCIEDYFQYIVDSRINGQISQAKNLYSKLSKEQRKEFFTYVDTSYHYDAEDEGESSTKWAYELITLLNS